MQIGFRWLFFLLMTWLTPITIWAEAPLCVNAKPGKPDLTKNLELANQINNSTDPLILAWREKVQAHAGHNHDLSANELCDQRPRSTWSSVTGFVETALKTFETPPPRIKEECIQKSLQRDINNDGYICRQNRPTRFDNSGPQAPCITPELSSYISFAVNEAIACVSGDATTPIDPRFILKKFNNETGFNFHLGYEGGVGLGQLTSNPVKEIAGWTEKTNNRTVTHAGNANYILEELLASSNPSCLPFQKTLANDNNQRPPLPNRSQNYCNWVSPGTGLARNLFYSLAYYRWLRDDVVAPNVRRRSPQLSNDKELINNLTLVAYGPGGLSEALSLMDDARLNRKTTSQKAIEQIQRGSQYLRDTGSKLNEITDDGSGRSCIE